MIRRLCWLVPTILVLAACTAAPVALPTPSAAAPASPAPSVPASPVPSATPSPTQASPPPSGSGSIASGAQAAALVLASEPAFANVSPLSPELIGGCCWYEVAPSAAPAGFEVTVTIGWGDCMAGCIDRHTWRYLVTPAGTITLLDQSGPQPPDDALPGGGSGPANVTAHIVAGPTCPVETQPPDPACAPRPVGNAQVIIRDHHGAELTRATSDADGSVAIELPAGTYILEPLPAEGLMGTPEPVAFAVTAGGFADLFLVYDTGIR